MDVRRHFCAGYLCPTVYASQQTVELLSDAELSAVLAHEHHHRRIRDPLRFACVRILSDALFFVPVLTRLSQRYADLAELSADRAAVHASGGEQAPLASALLAFDESGPPGVTGISPERVDSLLGQPIRWRLPLGLVGASIGSLAALGLLFWGASGAGSVHATLRAYSLASAVFGANDNFPVRRLSENRCAHGEEDEAQCSVIAIAELRRSHDRSRRRSRSPAAVQWRPGELPRCARRRSRIGSGSRALGGRSTFRAP
jgi:hypothetical protein